MRIAVVGSGVSGLVVARLLHPEHEITVFEGGDLPGGHACTVDASVGGRRFPVDVGFMVYNERTYPNFSRLLSLLGVASRPTSMSFSVRCERSGLEYNGTSLNALFAQRLNLFRPSFHRMIRDILRFHREAPELLQAGAPETSLGDWLEQRRYSAPFVEHYILPMGGAIWSSGREAMRAFPARFFVRFFHNHGMLSVDDRPLWRTVVGGSREYVRALTAPFAHRIRVNTPVRSVRRGARGVEVSSPAGVERFDQVVLACHAPDALSLLADPTPAERDLLPAFPYSSNEVVLHTDARLLPRRPLARASWNHHLLVDDDGSRAAVTYDLDRLQGLGAPEPVLATLNRSGDIDPARVLSRFRFSHPVFTAAGVAAQDRVGEISGVDRIHYAGAYWRYGFHEDGVVSALRVAAFFGRDLDSCTAASTRDSSVTAGIAR